MNGNIFLSTLSEKGHAWFSEKHIDQAQALKFLLGASSYTVIT